MKELIKRLFNIDKDIKLTVNNTNITENEIKGDGDNRVPEHIAVTPGILTRFTRGSATPQVNIQIRHKCSVIMNASLSEFEPCCGKILMHDINAIQVTYVGGELKSVDEKLLSDSFPILMEIAESICKRAKYSSISLIISDKGQKLLYKFMGDLKTYKVVNEFKNLRMNNETTCVEYCKNLW